MTQPRSHSQGYKSTTHRTPNSMFVQRTGARVSVSPGRAGEKASQVDFGRQDSSGKAGDKQGQRVQKPARPLRPLRRALSTGRRQPASRPLLRALTNRKFHATLSSREMLAGSTLAEKPHPVQPCPPGRTKHSGQECAPRPRPTWGRVLICGLITDGQAGLPRLEVLRSATC